MIRSRGMGVGLSGFSMRTSLCCQTYFARLHSCVCMYSNLGRDTSSEGQKGRHLHPTPSLSPSNPALVRASAREQPVWHTFSAWQSVAWRGVARLPCPRRTGVGCRLSPPAAGRADTAPARASSFSPLSKSIICGGPRRAGAWRGVARCGVPGRSRSSTRLRHSPHAPTLPHRLRGPREPPDGFGEGSMR